MRRMPFRNRTASVAVAIAAAAVATGCGGGSGGSVMPDVIGLRGYDAIAKVCAAGLRPADAGTDWFPVVEGDRGWTAYQPIRALALPIAATAPVVGSHVTRGQVVLLRARNPYADGLATVRGRCPFTGAMEQLHR
jgi:hypothetical protein